jgi:cytochrome b561
LVHRATYVLLVATLSSGFAIAAFAPAARDILLWRVFAFPDPVRLDVALTLHNAAAHALGAAVLLHIAGAFWHLVVRRDHVWLAMMRWRQ